MHLAASDYIFKTFHSWRNEEDRKKLDVLELGSFNINGSIKSYFTPFAKSYVGLDVQPGNGVDLVADAATYSNPEAYDVIVTAETFEHCEHWKQVIHHSYINLKIDGIFIATMAGEGRAPHSAIDTGPIRDWEHYHNIGEFELTQALTKCGFNAVVTETLWTDLRCFAVK